MQTKLLNVSRLQSDAHALNNVLNHNIKDFPGEYIHLRVFINGNFVVYPSISTDISPGTLGIGNIIRSRANLAFSDTVETNEVSIKKTIIEEFTLQVSVRGKSIISIHEEEFKELICKTFSNFYFSNGAILLLKRPPEELFVLTAKLDTPGYLGTNTKINLVSEDVNLNFIGSKLLKRDLFKEDYKFEEIGIGGLNNELLRIFQRALSTRAFSPQVAEKLGVKHVKGILLYGPPGCGKTLIARKIGNMISPREPKIINGPEIMNKFVGQSEENIRNLFAEAQKDKENSDVHVIIFDEIDAICKKRGRDSMGVNDSVVNQLLSMIDGVHSLNNIFIIAMTNRKDLIDDALLRAGRIEIHIEVGLPSLEGRKEILKIHTQKMKNSNFLSSDVNLDQLAALAENFTGAEIEGIVKNAVSHALQEQLASQNKIQDNDICVKHGHFLEAINESSPMFGKGITNLMRLLPEGYMLLENQQRVYAKIDCFLMKSGNFKSLLLVGEPNSGKTTLVTKFAIDRGIKYTRLVRMIDLVACDDVGKINCLMDIFSAAYLSDDSLIILDDLEILTSYAKMGTQSIFSNRVYQALVTFLKTRSSRNNMTIIGICTDTEYSDMISKYFDTCITLEHIKR